jgi:hypothetical protein
MLAKLEAESVDVAKRRGRLGKCVGGLLTLAMYNVRRRLSSVVRTWYKQTIKVGAAVCLPSPRPSPPNAQHLGEY